MFMINYETNSLCMVGLYVMFMINYETNSLCMVGLYVMCIFDLFATHETV